MLIRAFLFCWIASWPWVLAAQSVSPEVDDARNSIIAGTINGEVNQYNYYQSADPVDRRFSSAITLYVDETFRSIDERVSGTWIAAYDPADPSFRIEGHNDVIYLIIAVPFESTADFMIGSGNDRCQTEDGSFVVGVAYYGIEKPENPESVRIQMIALSSKNTVLKSFCRGLSDRSSFSGGGTGLNRFSNLDMVKSDEGGVAVFVLQPGTFNNIPFEEALAARYWNGFEQGLEFASPNGMLQLLGRQQSIRISAEFAARGRAEFLLDSSRGSATDFPERTRRAYGDRLDKMQASWLTFLESASVRVQGQSRRVSEHGKIVSFVPRFRASDIEGEKFWTEIDQAMSYSQGIACLAAVFAVNNGYSAPAELPFFRRCAG